MFNKSLIFLAACMSLIGVAQGFNGDATYYYTGLGSCGVRNTDTDHIVALSSAIVNNGAHCGQRIEVQYQGKSVICTVEDTCPECSPYSIDLSPSAFEALAPLAAGRIQVSWNYI